MSKSQEQPIVIEIKRHLVKSGIRRAPGQVLLMTPSQIRQQGLTRDDYREVVTRKRPKVTDRQIKPRDLTTR